MTTSMNDTIAQGVEMERVSEDEIVALVHKHFPWQDYPQAASALTYEKSVPMFPQATYDVPRTATVEFVRAVEAIVASRLAEQAPATHRHVKRGSEYVLIGVGKMQVERWYEPNDGSRILAGNVDMREVAIYRSVDDGSLWVRPREEFEDGRFEVLPSPVGGTQP